MKKILSLLLLLSMILSILPVLPITVGAADNEDEAVNVLSGVLGVSNDASYEWEPDKIGLKYLTDEKKLVVESGHLVYAWQSSYLPSRDVNVTIDFDLGDTYVLSSAALYPRGQDGRFFPEDYQVQVSEDGTVWKDVVTVTGDTGTAIEGRLHEFEEVKASHVRLLVTKAFATKASKGYVISLSELEVFGKLYVDQSDPFILDKEELWMDIGNTDKLTPVMKDGSEATFTFAAANDEVVTCDAEGNLVAVGYGDTTVTVTETSSGVEKTCRVKVYDRTVDNIIISVPMWRDAYINEKQIKLLYEAGVDEILKSHNLDTKNATDDTGLEDVEKMVEAARWTWENGGRGITIKLMTGELENALVNAPDEQIVAFAERFKNYPMLGGFHVKDEPFNPNPYARVVSLLNENSNGGAFINLLPGMVYSSYDAYEDVMRDYAVLLGHSRDKSILSMDNYPFGWGTRAVSEMQLFSNFNAIRKVGLETGMPTGYYVQGVGYVNAYRRPSESDLTYHFSTGLAYGMTNICYYTWFVSDSCPGDDQIYTDAIIALDGDPTELYDVAKDLHTQVHNVGPRLMNMNAVEVYHSGSKSTTTTAYDLIPSGFAIQPVGDVYGIVSLMVDKDTGRNYIMLVNKDLEAEQTLTYSLQGMDNVYLLDKTQAGAPESLVALDEGQLSVTLKAGEFAMYALPTGVDLTTPEQENANLLLGKTPCDASDSYSQNGWYFSKMTDGILYGDDTAKGWKTTQASAYVTYDLGEVKTFNRLDVYPAGTGSAVGCCYPLAITIEASDNGIDFHEVETYTNIPQPTDTVPTFAMDDTTARYIRLTFKGLVNVGVEVAELALYQDDGSIPTAKTEYTPVAYQEGDNVALGKNVFASEIGWTSDAEGLGYAFLTDGYAMAPNHPETGGHWLSAWPSDYHANVDEQVWVAVDLGATYAFDQVNLYPRGSDGRFFPEDYDIQVSDDGVLWRTVKAVTGDTSTAIEGRFHTFEETEARFVRVLIKKHFATPSASGYTTQLSELEVIASRTVMNEEQVVEALETIQTQIDNLDQDYSTDAEREEAIQAIQDQIDALNNQYATEDEMNMALQDIQKQLDDVKDTMATKSEVQANLEEAEQRLQTSIDSKADAATLTQQIGEVKELIESAKTFATDKDAELKATIEAADGTLMQAINQVQANLEEAEQRLQTSIDSKADAATLT